MTELSSYAPGDYTNGVSPPESLSVSHTVQYLKACSNLFEEGLLSHAKIKDPVTSTTVNNMKSGYRHFTNLCNPLMGKYLE
jgi:hypothetical protein